jgi:hypothetical protein
LRVGGEGREHGAYDVRALGEVDEFLWLPLRAHHEQPVADGGAASPREELQSGEGGTGRQLPPDCKRGLLVAVQGEGGEQGGDVGSLVARDQQHNAHFVLRLEAVGDCFFCGGVEILVGRSDSVGFPLLLRSLLPDALLLDSLLGLLDLGDGFGFGGALLSDCLLGRLGSFELPVLLLVGTSHSGHC